MSTTIDGHEWSKPIRYAGSIAEGPPPGRDHKQAVVYECARCHLVRIEPMTDEQGETMRDGLPNVVKRTVAVGQWWDGRTPCSGVSLSDMVEAYTKASKGQLDRALLLALNAGYEFTAVVGAMGDKGVKVSFACILAGWIDRGHITEAGRKKLQEGADA